MMPSIYSPNSTERYILQILKCKLVPELTTHLIGLSTKSILHEPLQPRGPSHQGGLSFDSSKSLRPDRLVKRGTAGLRHLADSPTTGRPLYPVAGSFPCKPRGSEFSAWQSLSNFRFGHVTMAQISAKPLAQNRRACKFTRRTATCSCAPLRCAFVTLEHLRLAGGWRRNF